jgi:hypothetical protein
MILPKLLVQAVSSKSRHTCLDFQVGNREEWITDT